jgi:methylenetetrahydrofolate dehydrogenase (NADP+)/methenyltetrahydrofolate cyclohydrolase
MELIDGNRIAAEIVSGLKREVAALAGRKPCIVLVRVGDDPASVSYVRKKERIAGEIGMRGQVILLPETAAQPELEAVIQRLNSDPGVDGILVQSPLPAHMDEQAAFHLIAPGKDVDGLHPLNLGKVAQEDPTGFAACTPSGIMELLARSGVTLSGRHVVVVGRSILVGRPFALLALQKNARANATVTVCHSGTSDLASITRQADVLVAAIGRPEFVTADMVRPGAVVIDVGINRVADAAAKSGHRLVGDVHFPSVSAIVGKITPVPGGVGPMTVAMLMVNTLKAFRLGSCGPPPPFPS